MYLNYPQTYVLAGEVNTALSNKQDTLVSGTNIKTINNESVLGSGNINVPSSTPTFIISNSINTDKGTTNQNAIDFDTLPVGTTIFKNYIQGSSFAGTITCASSTLSLGFSSMTSSYKVIGSSSVFFNQIEIEKYVDFTDAADLTDGTYANTVKTEGGAQTIGYLHVRFDGSQRLHSGSQDSRQLFPALYKQCPAYP